MRYFRLFDDISEPEGDVYRWDGKFLQMKMSSGVYSDHFDEPAIGETVEELMTSLAGPGGRWKEVDSEA